MENISRTKRYRTLLLLLAMLGLPGFTPAVLADDEFEDITIQVIGLDEDLSNSIRSVITIPRENADSLTTTNDNLLTKQSLSGKQTPDARSAPAAGTVLSKPGIRQAQ